MRRLSFKVKFTGSGQLQGQLNKSWLAPVNLSLRLNLRNFIATIRRTIYTTGMLCKNLKLFLNGILNKAEFQSIFCKRHLIFYILDGT